MQSFKINHKKYPVSSRLCNLKKIAEETSLFNIPIYQRLYVWGDDQIKTLLEDLLKGYEDKVEQYYLGGIMVSKNKQNQYELIDGQQRFTTLWLIGSVIKKELEEFNFLDKENRIPRLTFSIRKYADDFFTNSEITKHSKSDLNGNDNELLPIKKALKTIERFFKDNNFQEHTKNQFSHFVMHKVTIMITEMPENTDENRLFEALNNRGVQLQQHEILKAKMLSFIMDETERLNYAKLWDACSLMDEYIEKNIKDIFGLTWRELAFQPEETEKQVDLSLDFFHKNITMEAVNNVHLLTILTNDDNDIQSGHVKPDENELDYDSGRAESIISFSILLLHVLRIFQYDKESNLPNEDIAPVDEKKILEIFNRCSNKYWFNNENDAESEKNVKDFLNLLLQVRIGFDKYVIKWIVKDSNVKIHGIKKLYLNKEALQRKEPEYNDQFSLIQSMLYHSQQIITHYWLTPFLYRIRNNEDITELNKFILRLDNAMFCSGNDENLSQRSWQFLSKKIDDIKPDVKFLEIDERKGTNYPSYVFYKMEFVLWYFRNHIFDQKDLKETKREAWNDYRMTSKNSVEHISPQTQNNNDVNIVWGKTDSDEAKNRKLNDFGNLVLLTSNMNSEYSNNIYTTKRSEFLAKANNKRLDSLKSAMIFENDHWNWNLCDSHRDYMKKLLEKYFEEV